VLSRVDGSLTEAELVVCMGLDALVVTMAVERLASLGALRFASGVTRRPASPFQSRMPASARVESPPRPLTPAPPAPRESHVRGLTPAPAPRTSAMPGTTPPASIPVTPLASTYRPPSTHPNHLDQVKRYLEAARVALAEENSLSASNFYRLAQQLAPNDPAIRAAIEGSMAATAESRAIAERAAVFVRHGDAAARERRWQDAVTDYEEAAQLVPKDAAVLYKVAGALYRSDALRPAAEFAQRAVTLAPARVDTWLLLAQIHLGAGSIALAQQALAEAQRLAPDDERVGRLRAKVPA
jgi:hypothetical protein